MSCDGTQCFACQDHRDRLPVVPVVRFDSARQYGKAASMAEAVEELRRLWAQLVAEDLPSVVKQLKDAGLLVEEPPSDPKERALWARRNRNTGPTRPSGQAARRPRRHR